MDVGTNKKLKSNKAVFFLFAALFLFLMCYLISGQVIFGSESTIDLVSVEKMDDNWTIIYPDGSKGLISVPTEEDVFDYGETITITNVLPDNEKYAAFRMWNYGHDFKIYIDGKLRYTYGQEDVRGVGPDRPYMSLYYPLYEEDLGKEISIEITAATKSSAHKVGPIYVGNEIALLNQALFGTAFELFIGMFMILVGIAVIIIGVRIQKALKVEIPLVYLGIAVLLCSFWLIFNSTGRQYMIPNVSFTRNCSFLIVMLMPIPFALFFDSLQRKRYHIAFHVIEVLCLADFAVQFSLHITNVMGFSEMFPLTVIMVVLLIVTILFTVIRDFIVEMKTDFYNLTAIGIFIFGILAIAQIITYSLLLSERYNGLFMGAGLLIVSVLASTESVRNFKSLYSEHRSTVNKMATLSHEAMETIAKTVDAKDQYTHEHSTRVAEYASLLATKLGWTEEDVDELERAALLHDIGKIGIPDSVLNKPGKLTDEEYEIIKSHTTIGAEILRNISSLKYAYNVALYHHEKFDGTGYPEGLSGKAIPKCARIVCIADSFDAMNSRRVYRSRMDIEAIKDEMRRCRGKQFDPDYLDAFLELIDD